jgi:superfamily II DNA/RNA helicase
MKNLCFKKNPCIIVDSPDRENIKISVQKIKNNSDVQDNLQFIFHGLKNEGVNFPKHLVFCNTIKECSLVYSALVPEFGHNSLLVNMYHSKTPDDVKKFIRKDMEAENGNIRVLVSTSSAGMGVNFKDLQNIVHFSPPRDMDTFIQQMGRAGRDGKASHELLLYRNHRNVIKNLDQEMLKLVSSTSECRRDIIADCYLTSKSESVYANNCCDICEAKCQCGEIKCHRAHVAFSNEDASVADEQIRVRSISDEEITLLRHKLNLLRDSIDGNTLASFVADLENLSKTTIEAIICDASKLFSIEDILQYVWSYRLAKRVHEIICEVFDDITVSSDNSSSDSD